MRTVREILRQKWVFGRSHREVQAAVGVSLGAITAALSRAAELQLDWAALESLSDTELAARWRTDAARREQQRVEPDCGWIHTERKRPGVTLELLHQEYLGRHPDGYRYTAFCDRYRRWLKRYRLSMRQVHRAGEKMFTDYSGKKPTIVDGRTGEVVEVELFVAVLAASSYTYAEATETQQIPDWIASHVHALEYFQGAPEVAVPDQLKSGVTTPCRYEPAAQRNYEEMANHYGMIVLPARPRKPRDKAKVEVGVQVVSRWILARIRNETFFSLTELNARIRELLDALNRKPMKAYGASRRELFERLDQPMLRPLPKRRFCYAEWKRAKVNIDYHIEFDRHYYSVPHALVGEPVEVRASATTIEVFSRQKRVASHRRSSRTGQHTTDPGHMPKAHRAHLEWSPSRLISWGASVGPKTEALVQAIFESRRHPEQGYRSCLGILRLEKAYGSDRLEAAADRSLQTGGRSYRHVNAILKNGLDRVPLTQPEEPDDPIVHEHVRGSEYYADPKAKGP